jgi:hypothetical protein
MNILQTILENQDVIRGQLLAEQISPLFENEDDLVMSEAMSADDAIFSIFGFAEAA